MNLLPVTSPWGWVLAIHILSITIWVGGMFFALTVLRPSLAALEPAPRIALHNRVFRRFFLIIWHAMPIALISGFAMVFGLFGGLSGFSHLPWNVQTMMAIGVIMAVIFLLIVFGPYRRFRSAVSSARAAEALDRIRRLIEINLVLGIINIFLAAI
ncbi:MAG TPA: CopD family protein [Acetobacteraceae bacterium]